MNHLRIAAACLFDDDGRLLLVRKRDTRFFMLPGGKFEAGESAREALRRELFEELHLQLPNDALQPLGRYQAPAANEPGLHIDADIFVARLPRPVSAAAELEELAWHVMHQQATWPLAPLLVDHVLPALAGRVDPIR
ncbi:NUDIX hydrolase [Pseudomonas sp. LRF_L74]|uniref:NUDIX hydrolase n=1 Tax=Pseudomonas sp. LRF_L74 TaxID=3369422 RepID=UPI003F5F6592